MPRRSLTERGSVTDKVLALCHRIPFAFAVKLHGEAMQRSGLPDVLCICPRPGQEGKPCAHITHEDFILGLVAARGEAGANPLFDLPNPPGVTLFIECKRPGNKPTDIQADTLRRAVRAGVVAMAVNKPEYFENWLRMNGWQLKDKP